MQAAAAVPAAVDVVREQTGANLAKVVEFGEVFDLYDGGHG